MRHREVESQSRHPSWKLMRIVTSCGVETEREGANEEDGGVAGESTALLFPRVQI